MFLQILKWSPPAALALAVLVLSSLAAPVINSDHPVLNIDKYLLDDTDGVLVINVKDILASPAYKKGLHKQISEFFARANIPAYLKDIGFDPPKDVERVIVCVGKSCFTPGDWAEWYGHGPLLLLQGKFDAAKVKAKMAALAKNNPKKVRISNLPGGQTIYEIEGGYAAQLDGSTIVLSDEDHVLAALEKASGKKTTRFIHKEVAGLIKKLKTDVAVQGFALGRTVITSTIAFNEDGKSKQDLEFRCTTFADKGFKDAMLSISIKDDARGILMGTVKDKEEATSLTERYIQGLDEIRKDGRPEIARLPSQIAPVVRFLDGVAIKSVGKTIRVEGKADTEMIQALLKFIFKLK